MRAVVNAPICPLMTQPRHDCSLADEALYGMVVEVLEKTNADYWKVRTHYRYEGYAPVSALLTDPALVSAWEALKPCYTPWSKNFIDVMAQPEYQSRPLITLPRGAMIACGGYEDGWTRVTLADGREGYARSSWVTVCEFNPDFSEDELRQRLCDTALLYTHTPYRWGGKSPLGIDCSGLVSMTYLLNGIVIWRDAELKEGFPLREISRGEAKKGDLLFFPGHVAMYLGDGLYLHATGKADSDGVCLNSLVPTKGSGLCKAPYREDLDKELTAVGTYF